MDEITISQAIKYMNLHTPDAGYLYGFVFSMKDKVVDTTHPARSTVARKGMKYRSSFFERIFLE
jgi:hypothetical protein